MGDGPPKFNGDLLQGLQLSFGLIWMYLEQELRNMEGNVSDLQEKITSLEMQHSDKTPKAYSVIFFLRNGII